MPEMFNFRCPDDVLEAISDRAAESGESKSSVVIAALRYAFELADHPSDAVVGKSVLQQLEERLTALEGKLLA
ncbi:MAG: Arc family DNA-binding protein [Chroococcidiopsis sp.]